MDQLRTILAWLKRQHFWVLSGLIALVAIGCWWQASGTLSSEFATNKQAIEGELSSIKSARGKPFLPNQTIIEKQKAEIAEQAEGVAETWQKLYDRQREHVLKWPIPPLSQEFGEHVENRKFGDDIPRHLLTDYQNYARRYFPELPEIVDAPELEETMGGNYGEGSLGSRGAYSANPYGERGLGTGQLEELPEDFICEWRDQHKVREALIFPQRPTPLKVWVTQEDLWVYKTLLNVIRRTNEAAGATRQSNAAVRIIYALDIGRDAALLSRGKDRIYMRAPAAAAANPYLGSEAGTERMTTDGETANPYGTYPSSGIGPMSGRSTFGESYGGTTGGTMTPEQEQAFLLSHRYLDAEGKPIPFGGGAAAGGEMGIDPYATDAPAPAAPSGPLDLTQFGLEYKRLPVRMTLQMDQRWLTHLISECANQPLQVEVQEVRINPSDLGSTGGEGRGLGYGGGLGGGGYGGGRGYGGGGGASPFPDRTGVQTFNAQPHIVDVAIQGIIYIFNEPNTEALKTAEEGQMASNF